LELNDFKYRFRELYESNSFETSLQFYLFGSFLTKQNYLDIDILILYDDFEVLQNSKSIIETEFSNELVHFICLTTKEESETDFIKKTNAKQL
jgi:predicted nucleotidyltransferase